jgi:heme exporter protein A
MSLSATALSCIRQDRLIFSGVDVSLSNGELLWVKGRNGAGKSSLLRILANLLKPVSGDITWDGTNISDDPEPYQKIFRYIGHQDGLKSALTPRENLSFWTRYLGQNNLQEALSAFELSNIADNPVRILSAGQKKRTHLARLLTCPARLWILDEPISSLDVHYIDLFRQILANHLAAGGMALLATHQDLQVSNTHILDLDMIERAAS